MYVTDKPEPAVSPYIFCQSNPLNMNTLLLLYKLKLCTRFVQNDGENIMMLSQLKWMEDCVPETDLETLKSADEDVNIVYTPRFSLTIHGSS